MVVTYPLECGRERGGYAVIVYENEKMLGNHIDAVCVHKHV